MYSKCVTNECITCQQTASNTIGWDANRRRERERFSAGFTIHYPLSLTIINTQSHLFNLFTSSLSLEQHSWLARRHTLCVKNKKEPPTQITRKTFMSSSFFNGNCCMFETTNCDKTIPSLSTHNVCALRKCTLFSFAMKHEHCYSKVNRASSQEQIRRFVSGSLDATVPAVPHIFDGNVWYHIDGSVQW